MFPPTIEWLSFIPAIKESTNRYHLQLGFLGGLNCFVGWNLQCAKVAVYSVGGRIEL